MTMDINDLIEAAEAAAYLIKKETECDICDRFKGSDRDGIEVCTRCRLAEVLAGNDWGQVADDLETAGVNGGPA